MRGEAPPTHVEPDVTLPMPAYIPDDYVPDVHQRLMFYKRFSVASTPDELTDLRAELVDRFGDAPLEVDNLSELMLLKIDMRELRLRGLEAGPARLVVTLGADAKLDPIRLASLVQRSRGVYRLTPEMKLIARVPAELEGQEWVVEAKKVLRDVDSTSCVLKVDPPDRNVLFLEFESRRVLPSPPRPAHLSRSRSATRRGASLRSNRVESMPSARGTRRP